MTTREANRIVPICYEQQLIFPKGFAERHELSKLALVASSLKVEYTAAGFFQINRTTLFSVLSVVTTYFIVILQFRK